MMDEGDEIFIRLVFQLLLLIQNSKQVFVKTSFTRKLEDQLEDQCY